MVGPSGAGKSTLANLLSGVTPPDSGDVLLGGVPLPRIDPALVRRRIALIPQEAYVFAGTLRENLTYLAPEATDRRLDSACVTLGLRPLVDRLGGYDAPITAPHSTLSSGERQLVALARVYLSPARIVVLDEATCYLDPVAEQQVEQAFATREGTLVVVAHRLSSARRAETILLMDGPRVVHGTHDELLATSATYAQLVGHWRIASTGKPPVPVLSSSTLP